MTHGGVFLIWRFYDFNQIIFIMESYHTGNVLWRSSICIGNVFICVTSIITKDQVLLPPLLFLLLVFSPNYRFLAQVYALQLWSNYTLFQECFQAIRDVEAKYLFLGNCRYRFCSMQQPYRNPDISPYIHYMFGAYCRKYASRRTRKSEPKLVRSFCALL